MTVTGTPSALPATAQDWAGEMGQRWLANLSQFEGSIAPVGEAMLARAAYRPGERRPYLRGQVLTPINE